MYTHITSDKPIKKHFFKECNSKMRSNSTDPPSNVTDNIQQKTYIFVSVSHVRY